MSASKAHTYRTFVLCRGEVTVEGRVVNPNAKPGEFTQVLYLASGSGVCSCGEDSKVLTEGTLTDLSEFRGKELVFTCTSEKATWEAFNPILPNTRLLVSIFTGAVEVDLFDPELETYIVPLKGSVQVNGKTIEELKCGRLLVGKSGALRVPKGAACAIVKVVREEVYY